MMRAGHRHKVLKAVIVLDAIEVMNDPLIRNRPISRRPDSDVLPNIATTVKVADEHVAFCSCDTALPIRIGRTRTMEDAAFKQAGAAELGPPIHFPAAPRANNSFFNVNSGLAIALIPLPLIENAAGWTKLVIVSLGLKGRSAPPTDEMPDTNWLICTH